MKTITSVVFLISCIFCCHAQIKFEIAIYQNTDLFETNYNQNRPNEQLENVANFTRFSLALNIRAKGNLIHELEFFIPEISKPLECISLPLSYQFQRGLTFQGNASSYSFRYELRKKIMNLSDRFILNVGLGVNPYYVFIEYIPNVETTYYSWNKLYGFSLNINPRLQYKLNNRFILEFSIPLKFYDFRKEQYHVSNPSIPISYQTVDSNRSIFFENAYTFRLGLSYLIN